LESEFNKEKEQLCLQEEITRLEQDTVEEIVTEKVINAYQGGKYTDDICYELLSVNSGIQNIKTLITSVQKILLIHLLIVCPVTQICVMIIILNL